MQLVRVDSIRVSRACEVVNECFVRSGAHNSNRTVPLLLSDCDSSTELLVRISPMRWVCFEICPDKVDRAAVEMHGRTWGLHRFDGMHRKHADTRRQSGGSVELYPSSRARGWAGDPGLQAVRAPSGGKGAQSILACSVFCIYSSQEFCGRAAAYIGPRALLGSAVEP